MDDFENDNDADDNQFLSNVEDGDYFSAGGNGGGGGVEFITGRQKGVDVVKELKVLCLEHEKGNSLENLAIELNSFKFSQNASYVDCNHAAVLACYELVESARGGKSVGVAGGVGLLKKELASWSALFKKLSPRVDDQIGVIIGLEAICTMGEGLGQVLGGQGFRFLLQICFDDLEILSEESITAWAEKRKGGEGGEEVLKMFGMETVVEFLEWMAESEEESSDEEEEND